MGEDHARHPCQSQTCRLGELVFAGREEYIGHRNHQSTRSIHRLQHCVQLCEELCAKLALRFHRLSSFSGRLLGCFVSLLFGGLRLSSGLCLFGCKCLRLCAALSIGCLLCLQFGFTLGRRGSPLCLRLFGLRHFLFSFLLYSDGAGVLCLLRSTARSGQDRILLLPGNIVFHLCLRLL